MSIARIEFISRPDAGAVERRRHPVEPVAAPPFDYRSMLFICRMSSCGSPVALLGGLDDGLQVIPLDLAVQGTAGDPECSRRLCQISVRALQRPFDCEVLEVAEACALGHGRCGCIPGGCCGRCLENLCRYQSSTPVDRDQSRRI